MIIDELKQKSPYVSDQDEDQFIGLNLPFILDNGLNGLSTTTIDAIKSNLLNLINTEKGERPMQPFLGVGLRDFLFEPFSEDLVIKVQDALIESISYWLPFVKINSIDVKMSDSQFGDFRSTMNITVGFSLKKDPTTHESITTNIGE